MKAGKARSKPSTFVRVSGLPIPAKSGGVEEIAVERGRVVRERHLVAGAAPEIVPRRFRQVAAAHRGESRAASCTCHASRSDRRSAGSSRSCRSLDGTESRHDPRSTRLARNGCGRRQARQPISSRNPRRAYRAAVMITSMRRFGSPRLATPIVARDGRSSSGIHSSQALFISSFRDMSLR